MCIRLLISLPSVTILTLIRLFRLVLSICCSIYQSGAVCCIPTLYCVVSPGCMIRIRILHAISNGLLGLGHLILRIRIIPFRPSLCARPCALQYFHLELAVGKCASVATYDAPRCQYNRDLYPGFVKSVNHTFNHSGSRKCTRMHERVRTARLIDLRTEYDGRNFVVHY